MRPSGSEFQDLDPMRPQEGDVVSAFYLWSQDDKSKRGRKLRPCLVVKASPDGSSVILAPISTKVAWEARDCVEIPPHQSRAAGLDEDRRKWVKLTEINRVDLPNRAIVPNVLPDGRMSWRRGRVTGEVLKQVQSEIGIRVSEKTLTGHRIPADENVSIRIAAIRRAGRPEPAQAEAPCAAGAQVRKRDLDARIREKAREMATRGGAGGRKTERVAGAAR